MALRETSVDELDALDRAAITLIDVREPDEYAAAHVPGARLVPLATVPAAQPSLPTDEPLYLICRTGGRSLEAAEYLDAHGYDVVNVVGGTAAWVAAGKPVDTGARPE